jgi:hypothetical protein
MNHSSRGGSSSSRLHQEGGAGPPVRQESDDLWPPSGSDNTAFFGGDGHTPDLEKPASPAKMNALALDVRV